MSLQEAEGLAELELWEEALAVLRALPFEERRTSGAHFVCFCCHAGLEHRLEGCRAAREVVRWGEEWQRRIASLYFQRRAADCFQDLSLTAAARFVVEAIEAWPGDDMEVLDDPFVQRAVEMVRASQGGVG